MNELYPVAKLGRQTLLINTSDLPHIGKTRSLEIKTVKVDLQYKSIDPISELEEQLKFIPWEETTESDRLVILHALAEAFSEQEILEKIVVPLVLHAVKSE